MHENPGFRLNTPLVALQEIEGEAILINFDTGCYFSANRTGALLLELAEPGASATAMIRALAHRCGVAASEVEDHVHGFMQAAEDDGLVVRFEADGAQAASTNGSAPLAYEAPRLDKFDDLQDLLMLDPIHDVDQVGWPMQAPSNDASSNDSTG